MPPAFNCISRIRWFMRGYEGLPERMMVRNVPGYEEGITKE